MLNFILLSLLFAFVYWWYMMENRVERYVWLLAFFIIGTLQPANNVTVTLAVLLAVMIVQWYIGFKTGYTAIYGPE